MLSLCFVPLVLIGYASSIQTVWHSSEDISGPYVEVQTCKDHLGAHVKGAQGFATMGIHYGFTWVIYDTITITIQPQGGLGYSNTIHPTTRVRQITKFEAGLQVSVSYEKYVLGVEYTHMSNGRGVDPTNAGQDLWGVQVGYQFK